LGSRLSAGQQASGGYRGCLAMKRSAVEAFAPAAPATGVFQPSANAMLDPKAYFAQFQQAAMQGQSVAAPGTVITPQVAAAATAALEEKTEIQQQVEKASAVRCAQIVKDKSSNFTTVVAIAALETMATKSSYHLREELLRQQPVKKLCERVRDLLLNPPSGLSLEILSKAAWCLVRFPKEVLGTAAETLAPLAKRLEAADPGTGWHGDTAARILWCLTKASDGEGPKAVNVIMGHKRLVSKVVKELVRDIGRRVGELSQESLINLLSSITMSRVFKPSEGEGRRSGGAMQTVRLEANDDLYFSYASKRVIDEVDTIDAKLIADVAHVHANAGIRDETLFKAICPRIMAKQKELDVKTMGNCIKAYARFMIPLREESQGFRTMAVIAKGDFIRPSDKPKKTGPKKYDMPVPLYSATQLHSRG